MIAQNRLATVAGATAPAKTSRKAKPKKRQPRKDSLQLVEDARAWVQHVRHTIYDLMNAVDIVQLARGESPKLAALLVGCHMHEVMLSLTTAMSEADSLLGAVMPPSPTDPLTAKLTGRRSAS